MVPKNCDDGVNVGILDNDACALEMMRLLLQRSGSSMHVVWTGMTAQRTLERVTFEQSADSLSNIYAWRNWINHHKTRFRYLSLAAVLSEIGHLRLKSQLFRLRQPILLSAGGSKVSCSRFIQFLQAHTSPPERDATSLRSSPVAKCSGSLYLFASEEVMLS